MTRFCAEFVPQLQDGRRFAAPQRFPHRTYSYDKFSMDDSLSDAVFTAPALVGTPDRLYLTWMGDGPALTLLVDDGRAFTMLTLDENRSTAPVQLPQARSMEGPALCGHRRRVPARRWLR